MTDIRILSVSEAKLSNSEVCGFYEKHWERPIALARNDFFTWQMNQAPDGEGHNHSIVALQGDKILAVMGVTPTQFLAEERTYEGAQLTTWVVSAEARGKGIGTGTLKFLQNRYAILAGAGITESALSLYLRAGFTFLAHIPRFFSVVDFVKAQVFTDVSPLARAVQERRQMSSGQSSYSFEKVSAVELAVCAQSIGCAHFGRDPEWLKWRFDLHPAFEYEAFIIRDPSLAGQGAGAVLRFDTVQDVPIVHVIDLFGAIEHIGSALTFVEDEAVRRGAAFVDISLTAGPLIGHLRARGWNSVVDDPHLKMPSLFHPLEMREPATTSMVLWARDAQARVYDFNNIHITRADMDLDRPTLHWYKSAGLGSEGALA